MSRLHAWKGVHVVLFAAFLLICGCGDDGGTKPIPNPDVTAPEITGPGVREVTATSAVVHWTTDENSRSTVFWSPDTTAGWQGTVDSSLVSLHSVTLSGLAPETRYFFAVRSTDAAGNASGRSEVGFFETFSTLPTLVMDPWEARVAVGDTLRLAIRILNVADLFGAAFDVGPLGGFLRLDADTLSAGSFLGPAVQTLFLYDGAEDVLEIAISRLYPAGGADGNGTLGWLRLAAAGTGSGTLGFRSGSIALRDPSGQPVAGFEQLVKVESEITIE